MDEQQPPRNHRRKAALSLLAFAIVCLILGLLAANLRPTPSIDLSLRGDGFPSTFIKTVHVDLTSPNHWVQLTWTGPLAEEQETGPFRSSPGTGFGVNDCNDPAESRRQGSNCTPKGTRLVEGFSDHLPSYRDFRFVTWFDRSRQLGLHSHWQVPLYPASHGCVRLNEHAAQLIHNNSLVGETEVTIDGTWTEPPVIPAE